MQTYNGAKFKHAKHATLQKHSKGEKMQSQNMQT